MAKTPNTGPRIPAQQSSEKRASVRKELSRAVTRAKHDYRPPFERHERKRNAKPATLVGYDFESTRIEVGTPRPLYLTAFGADMCLEVAIRSIAHLTKILITHFLTSAREGTKYVAWNGNRFDAYFIAAALIREDTYTLKPYLTKSKTLRGLRVIQKYDADGNELDPKHAPAWEFLCGIAMLGLPGVSLARFLANFAPDHAKLTGVIDFEKEEFNTKNKKHREYALRDSEGLYHGMVRAQKIMIDAFNEPLAVTIGGVCIKIFQAHIPRDVTIEPLIFDLDRIVRRYVVRGGFCFLSRRYDGPVWKYDINQAYAAAMRDAKLPAGSFIKRQGQPKEKGAVYIAWVSGTNKHNRAPFYHRSEVDGRLRTLFATDTIGKTWLTSIEVEQLRAEGWALDVGEVWQWSASFSMTEYVDKLEVMRGKALGGPSGPIGTMIKGVGNNSYGKMLEAVEPIEFVLGMECPDDCLPFYDNGFDALEHVFYRMDPERKPKPYHQPHVGAFITAHVRMVLRRAILLNSDAWLYADTDCLVFSEDMGAQLDIDPKRYGAWKIEEEGTRYKLIAKKVYVQVDGEKPKRSAKGLNVNKLTAEDFARWYEGDAPEQKQVQLNNFLAVLVGADMFRGQTRKGTRVEVKTA